MILDLMYVLQLRAGCCRQLTHGDCADRTSGTKKALHRTLPHLPRLLRLHFQRFEPATSSCEVRKRLHELCLMAPSGPRGARSLILAFPFYSMIVEFDMELKTFYITIISDVKMMSC